MPSTGCVSPPCARLNRTDAQAIAPSNAWDRCRRLSQIAYVHESPLRFVPLTLVTSARRDGSATGSDRSSRPLTMEKMAVLAPMPSASGRIATIETTGVARSDRTARRMSCMMRLDGAPRPFVGGESIVTAMIAMTREVSPAFANCELTHLTRPPIDIDLARAQHDAYENALEDAGCRIDRLPAGPDMPDSVFIEDAAVVFDEIAVLTRPGAESRRAETPAVAAALARYRSVCAIQAPGTMDGGDVMRTGRYVFVGVSTRTNLDAIAQVRRMLAPHDYTVVEVQVSGCLHLKSAVTPIGTGVLLINPALVPKTAFTHCDFVE